MKRMIRMFVGVSLLSGCLILGSITGCSMKDDYHQGNDDKWLIEQVEKGYLTQEQADAIREQQKNPKYRQTNYRSEL